MPRKLTLIALALVIALIGPAVASGASRHRADSIRTHHRRAQPHRRIRRHHRTLRHQPLHRVHRHRARTPLATIALMNGSGHHRGTGGTTTTPTPTSTPTPTPTPFPQGVSSTVCDLIAAPTGSDTTGNGSAAAPFASLQKLDSALTPGQTGCLRGGSYGSTSTHYTLSNAGIASAPITITSYPGETATVQGWVDIEGGYQTLEHLSLDGSNTFYQQVRTGTTCPAPVSQGLVVAAPGVTLQYDDIYQSVAALRGEGIGIGWWGNASGTTVRYNKIHDTGQCDQFDHSIYLASGSGVQIYGNWIWNNHGGQAVSVYPNVISASIHSNVIDASDSGFDIGDSGGSNATASVAIFHNIVSDLGTLSNKDQGWSMPGVTIYCTFLSTASLGNQAYDNNGYNNGRTTTGCLAANIAVSGLTATNPGYTDASNHNYALSSSSPFAGWGIWDGANS
jgi:hypothetical protein